MSPSLISWASMATARPSAPVNMISAPPSGTGQINAAPTPSSATEIRLAMSGPPEVSAVHPWPACTPLTGPGKRSVRHGCAKGPRPPSRLLSTGLGGDGGGGGGDRLGVAEGPLERGQGLDRPELVVEVVPQGHAGREVDLGDVGVGDLVEVLHQ